MTSFLSMAKPLLRPKLSYSPTNFPSFVRIWMRWLWRSATISRPWESNSSACGVHPHISVSIDMDAMRPHEHPSAKAPDLLPSLIEMVDWVRFRAEAARDGPGRASIGGPHRFAIPVDGHAVGAAPRPSFHTELCPIPDDAIGIGAAVDGLNFIRQSGASSLLRLNAGSLQRNPQDDDQGGQPESQ